MEYKHLGLKADKIKKEIIGKDGKYKSFSVVEKLAYNNAAKYEHNDKTYNYTRKQVDDFLDNISLVPASTKTNKTALELFKELEDKTSPSDIMARNYIIVLPVELDHDTHKKVIQDFFQEYCNQKKVFLDISFHTKNKGEGNENPHCHILASHKTLDKEGNISKAFRDNNNYDLKKLDDYNFIKKELSNRFNIELKKQNKNVIYTELSNEKLVKQSLENNDFETAIKKNYNAKYKRKERNNQAFSKNSNYADQKKKQWAAQQREEKRRLKEEAQQKAEHYTKTKKEIELLEIEQKFIEEDLKNIKLFKSDFLEQEITKQELKNYYLKNKGKLVELYKHKQKYEEEKREKERINRDLIISFFEAKASRDDLNTNKQIKDYFKEKLINKGYKYDDELKFFVDSLSYNLFKKQDYYLNKVPYFVYKNIKEDEELKYQEILEKEKINEEERAFKEMYERKREFKNSFNKEIFNYVNNELKLSRSEYDAYIEMIIKQQFDLKNQQSNNIFSNFESKFIVESKTKFFTNEEIVKEIFENKEAFLKRLENNKEIKNQRDRAIEKIENSKEIAKAAQNLAKEVLEEEDENIRELYNAMDDILNDIYKNNKNNVYNNYKFN
ncbi:TPA: MobA/MobL family protein [Haemophilus influenzae]